MDQVLDRAETKIVVEDHHFTYLAIQKGSLSMFTDNRQLWHRNYVDSLYRDYQSMKDFLPERATSVLDVGSGLGGINILLNRHYGNLHVELLDGRADKPVMRRHRVTFNDMDIARDFLLKNGVYHVETWDPNQTDLGQFSRKNDLIISLGSWCFHYPPDEYLRFVKAKCHPRTVLILDVRNNYAGWWWDLMQNFESIGIAKSSTKFTRHVFKWKA